MSSSAGRSDPRRDRRVILLDTNVFLPPIGGPGLVQRAEELAEGAEVTVPSAVLRELDRLDSAGVAGAALGRELAGRCRVLVTPGRGDAAILRAALAHRAILVTADRELQARARSAGVEVAGPRDRGRLVLLRGRAKRSPANG